MGTIAQADRLGTPCDPDEPETRRSRGRTNGPLDDVAVRHPPALAQGEPGFGPTGCQRGATCRETVMNDNRYPDGRDILDPARRTRRRNRGNINAEAGWLAGAIFVVVFLALAFGLGRNERMASTADQPAVTTGAAPPADDGITRSRETTGQSSGQ